MAEESRQEADPLSFAEERLWFLEQFAPGKPTYTIAMAHELRGPLDLAALAESVDRVVARHDSLRTRFVVVEGKPRRVVEPARDGSLEVVDLTGLSREAAAEVVDRERTWVFDLETGPLVRTTLLRLGAQEHVLVVAMHHSISDGWSFEVFHHELAVWYRFFASALGSGFDDLSIQYGDYAVWQRDLLTQGYLDDALGRWRDRMEGAPDLLDLPADRPRPPTISYSGGTVPLELDAPRVRSLAALARGEGATVFMGLLAAYSALLARLSGQDEVVVGTPVANRVLPELEPLVGFFVNMLPVRLTLDGDPSFRALLRRARDAALDAFADESVPFEKIVEALRPGRVPRHHPLFQTALVFQNVPEHPLELDGIEVESRELHSGTSKFDVTPQLRETADGRIEGFVEYGSDLFDGSTIERWVGHLSTFLRAALERPDEPVSRLPLLEPGERRRLLQLGRGRDSRLPTLSITERFATQVQERPGAVAVTDGRRTLTYAELDAEAERLAGELVRAGVSRGDLVGLFAGRSVDAVVAMLGILEAGAAYLPLDAEYPPQRVRLMIEDAQAAAIVTTPELRPRLPADSPPVVLLGEQAAGAEGRNGAWAPAGDGDLAYVMYTSGSTGKPKGVCVPHRAVLRLVVDADYARFGPDEVFLQLAPISFDASTFEVWGALLNGGKVVVYPAGPVSPPELGRFVRESGVTTLWLTAGLFHLMVEQRLDDLHGLRQLLAGGDVLSPPHVARVLRELPGCRMINGYGPTETTTFACCHTVREPPVASVPIGRPIANTEVYVLDRHREPVPIGVAGELHVGGLGLAHGYLGDEAATAEKFVSHPFAASAGERLYRTGDLARFLADGTLEFRGRLDAQVKIRGFRVEPGEVEALLAERREVRESVVHARDDLPGGKQLVAYVVPSAGAEVDEAALRSALAARLPAWAVPAAIVSLAELPLSPNGKVDRAALPPPDRRGPATSVVPPRTPLERELCRIWSDLLELRDVGIEDSFFDLGGHSLLAAQLLARIRTSLGYEVSLSSFFRRPTVAAIADEVAGNASQAPAAPVRRPAAMRGPDIVLPVSFNQEERLLRDERSGERPPHNLALALRLAGRLDGRALEEALNAVVARHEALRTSFEIRADEVVQRVCPPDRVALERRDLRRCSPANTVAQVEAVARRPFELEAGSLLRAALFELAPSEHVLLVAVEQLAADGWSLKLLVEELAEGYSAYVEGREPALPPLQIQFADFARWERAALQGAALERLLDYAHAQTDGLEPVPRLDLPLVETGDSGRGSATVALPRTQAERLRAAGRDEGLTLFVQALTALEIAIWRRAGTGAVGLFAHAANRRWAETEPVIGWFANRIPIRTELASELTLREAALRVREGVVAAQAHQELPFPRFLQVAYPDWYARPLDVPYLRVQHDPVVSTLRRLELPSLDVDVFPIGAAGTSDSALTFEAVETADGVELEVSYQRSRFHESEVGRLLDEAATILCDLADRPHLRLSKLREAIAVAVP